MIDPNIMNLNQTAPAIKAGHFNRANVDKHRLSD
jgi:hypothetical protein